MVEHLVIIFPSANYLFISFGPFSYRIFFSYSVVLSLNFRQNRLHIFSLSSGSVTCLWTFWGWFPKSRGSFAVNLSVFLFVSFLVFLSLIGSHYFQRNILFILAALAPVVRALLSCSERPFLSCRAWSSHCCGSSAVEHRLLGRGFLAPGSGAQAQ